MNAEERALAFATLRQDNQQLRQFLAQAEARVKELERAFGVVAADLGIAQVKIPKLEGTIRAIEDDNAALRKRLETAEKALTSVEGEELAALAIATQDDPDACGEERFRDCEPPCYCREKAALALAAIRARASETEGR